MAYYLFTLKYIIWDVNEVTISKFSAQKTLWIFTIAMLISGFYPLINPIDKSAFQFLKTFIHLYYLVFFLFSVLILPINHKTWKGVIRVWLWLSIFINTYAVYQLVARIFDLPFAWIEFTNVVSADRVAQDNIQTEAIVVKFESFYRATSIFTEPSTLGVFNIITLCFTAIPLINHKGRLLKSSLVTYFIIALSLIGITLTFSLIAVASLFLIFFATLIFEKKKNWKFFAYLFGISALVILVADQIVVSYMDVSILSLFYDRVEGIIYSLTSGRQEFVSGESFVDRVRTSAEGFRLWQMNYLSGVGLGNTYNYSNEVVFVDSGLFAILGETGLIGALSFIALFLFTFLNIKRIDELSIDSENSLINNMAKYLILFIAFMNIVTSNQYVGPNMWFYLGFTFSIINLGKKELNEDQLKIKFFNNNLKERFNSGIRSYLKSN